MICDAIKSDVVFKFYASSFRCTKSVFGNASAVFKQIFEDGTSKFHGVVAKQPSPTESLTILLDTEADVFEVIHMYLHNPDLELDPIMLPSLCTIAKRFKFEQAWQTFGVRLSQTISSNNIGEVCSFIHLGGKDDVSHSSDPTEQVLVTAAQQFLFKNADSIASSQTGQLSARLYVDILTSSQTSDDAFSGSALNDWQLTEHVLHYCSHRVLDCEPLDEGAVGCGSDGRGTRKLTNNAHATAKDTVTDEIRMTISDTHLLKLNSMRPCSSKASLTSSRPLSCGSESAFSEEEPVSPRRRSSCSSSSAVVRQCGQSAEASPDAETCLLVRTSLGGGSISIHIGKLVGRLVCLSVKRRTAVSPAAPSSVHSAASSVTEGPSVVNSLHPLPTSVILPPSPPPGLLSPLPIPDAAVGLDQTLLTPGASNFRYSILSSLGRLGSFLSEARSAAGACLLSPCPPNPCAQKSDDPTEDHLVLIAGGYSQNRCLKSTEVLRVSRGLWERPSDRRASIISEGAASDTSCASGADWSFTSYRGPEMSSARGRLAVAALDGGSGVYVCGGSDGQRDLASVERLTLGAVDAFPNDEVKWQGVASMQIARSSSAATAPAHLSSSGTIVVLGGQNTASPLASVESYCPPRDEWTFLPSMTEARSQLCAATLNQHHLLVAVGGVAETPPGTPPPPPPSVSNPFSSSSATSVGPPSAPFFVCASEASAATGEALDTRTSRWIRLPDPILRCPVIGSSLVPLSPSSGRLLLIGGSNGHSALTQTQIFDTRAWSWLLGPSLSIGRASPCAVALHPSSSCGTSLQMTFIAVFGGYNVVAGGFLDTVDLLRITNGDQCSPGQLSAALPTTSPLSASPLSGAFLSQDGLPFYSALVQ